MAVFFSLCFVQYCSVNIVSKSLAVAVTLQNKLREEVIENVKWNVDRDSAESKQRDFLDWALAVKKDTVHHVSHFMKCCHQDLCHLYRKYGMNI